MARPGFVTPACRAGVTQAANPVKGGAMTAERPKLSTASSIAVNFGPLLLFFAGSKAGKALFERGDLHGLADADVASAVIGTGVFIVATLIAAVWHYAKTRHLPAAMIFTTVVVVLFGGLTIWLQDKAFIQLKPSIIYGVFAALLLGGLATGRPTLQLVMGDAVPGLTDLGWRLLTRNWALLFLALLAANETARRLLSYDDWLSFKVWGVTLVIFAFTMAQTPLLVKHGMKLD
jgi:intracellular septation protein